MADVNAAVVVELVAASAVAEEITSSEVNVASSEDDVASSELDVASSVREGVSGLLGVVVAGGPLVCACVVLSLFAGVVMSTFGRVNDSAVDASSVSSGVDVSSEEVSVESKSGVLGAVVAGGPLLTAVLGLFAGVVMSTFGRVNDSAVDASSVSSGVDVSSEEVSVESKTGVLVAIPSLSLTACTSTPELD